ncbi:MAG: hypothetical protein JWO67_2263 [Streptosporangiaceae bacterium]|nr:hypothetical protein [Streptosporangiaceae bacterium]
MTAAQDTLQAAPAAKPKLAGVTTAAVREALIKHYRKPGSDRSGEILIAEPQAPGRTVRRCDLLRIGMWASRGTGIDAHEIKVSRSDWLRELDDPAKAEAWWPYCSRFWIVAPPGIIQPGELPEGWGLMELPSNGRRFKVIVQAATKVPELTVPLLVELLRRADNQRLGEMDRMRERHRRELHRAEQVGRETAERRSIPPFVQQRLDLLERLEAAIGMELSAWRDSQGRQITAPELAAVLDDAAQNVTAYRRMQDAERVRSALLSEVRRLAAQLERIQ